ncbi:GIY-YIG nuclease family protein [Paenibacillus beijingensis]|uniref:GIY-YIG nuclease family protein n=1 Tax=Paenibacillus beijingensis TaxID=1126833 RepID=UPI0006975794|nr:GIY-YIG nuclease family protein [Paenibacillus beijingensis]
MPFAFNAGDYPMRPGCYIMKDASGRILYVGKSKCLRSRLQSYFYQNHTRKRLRELVAEIDSIEVILVNNETESLLLENNLIKIHKPPYNRALKRDNSGYAYLMLTQERIPRLDVFFRDRREKEKAASTELDASLQEAATLTELDVAFQETATSTSTELDTAFRETAAASEAPSRKRSKEQPGGPEQDAALPPMQRFGPFASAHFRNQVLEFVADHFKLRTCTTMPKRVCLLYHIKRCSGICEGLISEDDYLDSVRQAAELLASGSNLTAEMYRKMEYYSERLLFEKADNILRHIRSLEKIPERQIVDRETDLNQEVLYFGEAAVMIAKVQQGMLRDFELRELEPGYTDAACDRFVISRYREHGKPDELIVNRLGDPQAVKRALRRPGERNKGVPFRITLPKRGLKHDLLQLCKDNYDYRMRQRDRESRST